MIQSLLLFLVGAVDIPKYLSTSPYFQLDDVLVLLTKYLTILPLGWCAGSPDIRDMPTYDWATICMMWSLLYYMGYVISWLDHNYLEVVHSLNMSVLLRSASFWHQTLYHYPQVGGCQPPSAGSLEPFLRGMKCILFRGCDSLITPLHMS